MPPATTEPSEPVDPVDELLTAYLDGELPSEERQEVETRLVADRAFRQRLQRMQRSWELLEALPRTHVGERFAQTTVEMVSLRASQELVARRQSRWKALGGWVVGTLALLALAAGVGAAGVGAVQWLVYRRQLADLPIAQNLRTLRADASPELLARLRDDPAWAEHLERGARTGHVDASVPIPELDAVPVRERARRVAALDAEDRARLARAWEQFSELPGDERERLRDEYAAVRGQPDGEARLRQMTEYAAWLQSLRAGERARVQDAVGVDAKLAVIHELVDRQRLGWVESVVEEFDPETVRAIYEWCLDLAALRMGEYPELRSEVRLLVDRLRDDSRWVDFSQDRPEAFVARLIALPHLQRRLDLVEEVFGRRSAALEPTDEEFAALARELPESARRELDALGGPSERHQVLQRWARHAVEQHDPVAMQFAQERDFWEIYQSEEFAGDDRERLELMRPAEFRRALEIRSRRGRGAPPRRPPPGRGS